MPTQSQGPSKKEGSHPRHAGLWVSFAVLLCLPLMGQVSTKERMPNNEQEKKQMLDELKNQPLPRPEFAYQAFTDAQNRADGYASIRSQYEQGQKYLDDFKANYPQYRDRLKQAAQDCSPQNFEELQKLLYSLGPTPEFKDLYRDIQRMAALPLKQFCNVLKKEETFNKLDQGFNVGIESTQTDAKNKMQWAAELSQAWSEKAKVLEKESSKAVAQNFLSQDLWLVVLVLGVFAIGLLALMKVFADPIQAELVTSGQIIQLPTVMLLLVTILVLGLGGKIQENTIGTLLGGLAGYVLAQGVGRAAARAAITTGQNSTLAAPAGFAPPAVVPAASSAGFAPPSAVPAPPAAASTPPALVTANTDSEARVPAQAARSD